MVSKKPLPYVEEETSTEKKAGGKELERLNALREPDAKEEWEIYTALKWAGLRAIPRRKPTWRWNETNGLMARHPQI